MTNFRLLVAAAISLLAAAPAIAMPHRHHGYAYSRAYTSRSYSGDFDRRNTFN
jgi:hypothetical protein